MNGRWALGEFSPGWLGLAGRAGGTAEHLTPPTPNALRARGPDTSVLE